MFGGLKWVQVPKYLDPSVEGGVLLGNPFWYLASRCFRTLGSTSVLLNVYTAPNVPPFGCGSKPTESHFWVGEFTTHFRTYFSGWIGSRSQDFGTGFWPMAT